MVDRAERSEPRFPAHQEPTAAAAIDTALSDLGASTEDLGICGGAAGGDLLFAQACLARGMHLDLYIPFDEPTFLRRSVVYAGDRWCEMYHAVTQHARTLVFPMAQDESGESTEREPFSLNNRRMAEVALAFGPQRVVFLTLWDGKGGDGPGGTRDMVEDIRARGGGIHILDTTTLFALKGAEPR